MPSTSFSDSHAHLTSSDIAQQVDAVLGRAQAAGVNSILNIATDENSLRQGLELEKRYPWVHNAAAVHPHDAASIGEAYFPIVSEFARKGKLKAIGETGLDYHYQHSPSTVQQDFLRRHLHLALECHLPVVIHCREAFTDFFRILDAEYVVNGKHAPGVLHCFTGTREEAQEVIDRGWYLSMSGIVTFKKSEALREVARMVPLDKLLIETDAPYLAPQSKRGHPNEPAYVVETAHAIAAARGITVDELAKTTHANMRQLFKI